MIPYVQVFNRPISNVICMLWRYGQETGGDGRTVLIQYCTVQPCLSGRTPHTTTHDGFTFTFISEINLVNAGDCELLLLNRLRDYTDKGFGLMNRGHIINETVLFRF